MQKVSEYEQHAAECRHMARRMQDANQKMQLEDMANTWDMLARERRHQLMKREGNDPALAAEPVA
jgi:hypothetical protein